MTADGIVTMLVLRVGGEAVACGALRDASAELGAGTGELKRMYVRPAWRGRGLSRRVLTELEAAARARGVTRLVLETGVLQPEAIGLYLSAGYAPVPRYGEYADEADSRCFSRDLDGGPAAPGASPEAPRGPRGEAPARPVVIAPVAWDDAAAVAVRRAMVAELAPAQPVPDGGYARFGTASGAGAPATFLARVDDEPVGCVTVRRAPAPWPDGWAEVQRLYVSPTGRRAGVARRLLAAAEDAARGLGCTTAVVDAGIHQQAVIALYRSLGYRPVRPAVDASARPDVLWFARPLGHPPR
ncbi:GNAT family N-acetyltransferase [Cellulomonas shaoxiangyii]|uniref:GNAT family N-acetyltransferase n=2 Tax=Cellulomonas shaoxiangyii TaxID=2566013 RepID=A0A4V1CN42_9CELL|nr:GNAT family N-acetyltransferase [Cellulomonas shaoxiangyii]TGY85260.1 GNAT family N-acetyltransferase [Cellulomonas shaoxiangyii]